MTMTQPAMPIIHSNDINRKNAVRAASTRAPKCRLLYRGD
jgi:hypothetical protein